MENEKFYSVDNYSIYECKDIDMQRIIIEYGFKIGNINDLEELEEGCLYYVKNNNVYSCSWFDNQIFGLLGQEPPFNLGVKICEL